MSYVELLEKYLVLTDTTEINVKPIRTALVNIGNEIAGHEFREAIRDAYREVKDEEFRRQIAELTAARSAVNNEVDRQRQIVGSIRSEQDSLMQGSNPAFPFPNNGNGQRFQQLQLELADAQRRLELAEISFVELDSNLEQVSGAAEDYRQRADLVDTQLAQIPIIPIEDMDFEERLQVYEANLNTVIDPGAPDPNNRIVAPFEGLDIPLDGPFIAKDTRTPFERWLNQEPTDGPPWVQNDDGLEFSPDLMVPSERFPGLAHPPLVDNLGFPDTGFPLDGDLQGFPGGFQSAPLR